jgi:hypothetical protein
MTSAEFRTMALGFPGAVESAHVNHPDFRIHGKIFATLGYPDDGWGMVRLTPEQQRLFVQRSPEAFGPCRGTWGKGGATNVHLASADRGVLAAALAVAFDSVASRGKKGGAAAAPLPPPSPGQ